MSGPYTTARGKKQALHKAISKLARRLVLAEELSATVTLPERRTHWEGYKKGIADCLSDLREMQKRKS